MAAKGSDDDAHLPLPLPLSKQMPSNDQQLQSEKKPIWWRQLLAGGTAGAVSRTFTAPLDRIKVHFQVQTSNRSIVDTWRYMLAEGGVRSFWRGNGMNVLKIAPESAIRFTTYEHVKRWLRDDEQRQIKVSERLIAGASAGCAAQLVIYPMETLKTRLSLRTTNQYKGIADVIAKMYTLEGLRSFYRGFVPNIIGIIPYAGIDLAVYETLKRHYCEKFHLTGNEHPSAYVLLVCGCISSGLGQLCSYPLLLVRTRLQANGVIRSQMSAVVTAVHYKTAISAREHVQLISVLRHIWNNEGVAGLYRGITPNFIKVLPSVSLSYLVYEHMSRALGLTMS